MSIIMLIICGKFHQCDPVSMPTLAVKSVAVNAVLPTVHMLDTLSEPEEDAPEVAATEK